MNRSRNRLFLWGCFYVAALLVCLAALWLTGISNWLTTAVGCWLLICFASLCVPDSIWEKKLFSKYLR